MKQVKRKKQLQHPKDVTPEIFDNQNIMSDGCQSDGEDSDLSARAEEIANQVLADDQCKTFPYRVLPRKMLRQSGWAWFGRSL